MTSHEVLSTEEHLLSHDIRGDIYKEHYRLSITRHKRQ